jgi:hypothetical protein
MKPLVKRILTVAGICPSACRRKYEKIGDFKSNVAAVL